MDRFTPYKVSIIEITKFLIEYGKGDYPNLRLGQAFYNKYAKPVDGVLLPEPDLFYEEDQSTVVDIIFDRHIETDNHG